VALRVAVPERLRTAGIVCLVAGLTFLDESAVQGWVAWVGVFLLSTGAALFDGLDEGRLGGRQVGMIVLLLGLAAGTWATLVIVLTRLFLEAPVPTSLFVLLGAAVLAVVGGVFLRRLHPGRGSGWQWLRLAAGKIEALAAKDRAA
jgi:hypothetical protein